MCVFECPETRPYFNGSACISCAEYSLESGLRKPYWTGSECSDTCPNSAPAKHNGVCKPCIEADPNNPYWDGISCRMCSGELGGKYYNGGKCVDRCREHIARPGGNRACSTCLSIYQEEPLWSGGKCTSCPSGQYFANSACAANCPAGLLKPVYGQVCVRACGKHQVSDGTSCKCIDGLVPGFNRCVPPDDKSWVDFAPTCAAAGMVVSFNGSSCDVGCGDDEKVVDGRCACKESAIPTQDGYSCVSRRACSRIAMSDEGVEICLAT